MLCDFCGKNEATVHLTEIIDDQTRELHLCEPCAREKGSGVASQFGLSDLLAGLADFGVKPGEGTKTHGACAQCGMTYEDFRKLGRFGCGHCYETFQPLLAPLLKRIHGSTQHLGKAPATLQKKTASAAAPDELKTLKERLKTAIESEAFEEAARLRDRIRAFETKAKKKSAKGKRE